MNIRTGDGFMDIRVGNRIVVRGQQLIVEQFIFEQVDQRLDLNRVWASDKAGGVGMTCLCLTSPILNNR